MAIDKTLMDNLYKRAAGFISEEEVVEYSAEGEMVKKKVTSKYIPPDITAMKMYIELSETIGEIDRLSEEELEKVKSKLLKEIKKYDTKKAKN